MEERSLVRNEASVSYTPSMSEVVIFENSGSRGEARNTSSSPMPATVHRFTEDVVPFTDHPWAFVDRTISEVIQELLGDRNLLMKVVYTVCSLSLLLKFMALRPEYSQTEYTIYFGLFYFLATMVVLCSCVLEVGYKSYFWKKPEEERHSTILMRAEKKWNRNISIGLFIINLVGFLLALIIMMIHTAQGRSRLPTAVLLRLFEPLGDLHFKLTVLFCIMAAVENVTWSNWFSVRIRAILETLITGNLIVFTILFWVVYRKTSVDLKSTYVRLSNAALVSFEVEEATKTFLYGLGSIIVIRLVALIDIISRLKKADLKKERTLKETTRNHFRNVFIWTVALIGLSVNVFLLYQWIRNESIFTNTLNSNEIFKGFENLLVVKKQHQQKNKSWLIG